jgi:hypothetical protein
MKALCEFCGYDCSLFILGLFNGVNINSGYISSNDRMISESTVVKGSNSDPDLRYHSSACLKTMENDKIPHTASLWMEI